MSPSEPEFVVVIVGPSRGALARLAAGAVAGALPGGWLGRVVEVRVAIAPEGADSARVASLVEAVLSAHGLPTLPESELDPSIIESADIALATDAEVHRIIADWPTAAFMAESEPPEVFAAYEARALGLQDLDWRVRQDRSLPDLDPEAGWTEVEDALAATLRPARFVANVIRAVVTNQGPKDPRFGSAGPPRVMQARIVAMNDPDGSVTKQNSLDSGSAITT